MRTIPVYLIDLALLEQPSSPPAHAPDCGVGGATLLDNDCPPDCDTGEPIPCSPLSSEELALKALERLTRSADQRVALEAAQTLLGHAQLRG